MLNYPEKIGNANLLVQRNKNFVEKFKNNPLLVFVRSIEVQNKETRHRLMDAIQILSNYFQKTVMLRHVFCDDHTFLPITKEHLMEEFGHDSSLSYDRHERPTPWDAILETSAAWFSWKMLTLDNDEKTILVHLVLETSGVLFFQEAHKTITLYGETKYFETHAEADEKHEKMGLDIVKNLSAEKMERLFLVQQQGWDVMNVACTQIANIASAKD